MLQFCSSDEDDVNPLLLEQAIANVRSRVNAVVPSHGNSNDVVRSLPEFGAAVKPDTSDSVLNTIMTNKTSIYTGLKVDTAIDVTTARPIDTFNQLDECTTEAIMNSMSGVGHDMEIIRTSDPVSPGREYDQVLFDCHSDTKKPIFKASVHEHLFRLSKLTDTQYKLLSESCRKEERYLMEQHEKYSNHRSVKKRKRTEL